MNNLYKFKIGQKVKLKSYNLFSLNPCYDNTTGVIMDIAYPTRYYLIYLDEKFHKRAKVDGYMIKPLIHEKCLTLVKSLITNE